VRKAKDIAPKAELLAAGRDFREPELAFAAMTDSGRWTIARNCFANDWSSPVTTKEMH